MACSQSYPGTRSDYSHMIKHLEGQIWLIPCFANFVENFYQPLFEPLSIGNLVEELGNLRVWSDSEDKLLRSIIEQRGPQSWNQIAKELNTILYERTEVRTGRNCKERWNNHLNPKLVKGNWTLEEDIYILETQKELGNRWSEISKNLEGRTENSVKNRWNSLIKKAKKEVNGNALDSLIDTKKRELNNRCTTQPVIVRQVGVFQSLGYPSQRQVNSVRNTLFNMETDKDTASPFGSTPSPSSFLKLSDK